MSDLIDRKEAIYAWCKLNCGCEPDECGMTIEKDGAAECEFVEFLWNRPEYDYEGMKMSDLISRQAAIDAMSVINDSICEQQAVDALLELPLAQKTGRWKVTPMYIKCSECGESFMLIPQNYCPNCGAKMGEVTG